MKKLIEYGMRRTNTKAAFPETFKTKEEAEENRSRCGNPEYWEIVKREVIYGEWKMEE